MANIDNRLLNINCKNPQTRNFNQMPITRPTWTNCIERILYKRLGKQFYTGKFTEYRIVKEPIKVAYSYHL